MTRRLAPVIYLGVLALAVGCGGGEKGEGIIDHIEMGAELDSVQMSKVVLAWVGEYPIAVSDLRNHLLISTGPQNVEQYLQNPDIVYVSLTALSDQYVWGEKAMEAGYELTPSEKRQVESLKMELLATRYVADVVQEENRPSREEVEAYYNENQEKFLLPSRVAVRHIQVKTRKEAEDILNRIQNGADFIEMVQQYSTDANTRDLGGALGYLQKGTSMLGLGRDDLFEGTVLPMEEGEVGIAQSNAAWHVVKVEKKEGGTLTPLDEVYQEISDNLMAIRFNQNYNTQAATAREEVGVRFVDENLEAFTGVTHSPKRLMQQAAQSADPGGRLTIYRRVAFSFPDDPVAPEAQFMVAYTFYRYLKNNQLARKALNRLQEKWPDSDWARAGEYLGANLGEDPEVVGSPEDILRHARSESSN